MTTTKTNTKKATNTKTKVAKAVAEKFDIKTALDALTAPENVSAVSEEMTAKVLAHYGLDSFTGRLTGRHIANTIFAAELVKRSVYSGYKAFDANCPAELYTSYTAFRQTVRDLIVIATRCTAPSARTMFMYAKDLMIEQVKAEPLTIKLPNGKDYKLTNDTLSLKRDIKPKAVATTNTGTVENNANSVAKADETATKDSPTK